MELPFLDYNQDCPNIVRMRSNISPTEKTTGRYFLFLTRPTSLIELCVCICINKHVESFAKKL